MKSNMREHLKILIAVLCALICAALLSCGKGDEKPAVNHDAEISEGISSAERWIKLIDGGEYSQSRSSASATFRNALTESRWKEIISSARGTAGRNLGREIASREYVTGLPGAPEGEYVIIKYRSSFENRKRAIEVVTVMRDPDGKWRGAGYTLK